MSVPFFRGQDAPERLEAFRVSTPATAVLTIHETFTANLGKQIPHFDSRDEQLKVVLRFPGLPDAVGGTISGMRSYNRWLYFGELENGSLQGLHYDPLTPGDFVQDYSERIEGALGRKVQTRVSHEPVSSLLFTSPVEARPTGSTARLGAVHKIFLLQGRVLFGCALAFETETQLRRMLDEFQRAYGVRPVPVPPRNDQVFAFTPERVRTWLDVHAHLLPPVQRQDHFMVKVALKAVPAVLPPIPFDLIIFDFDNTLAFTTPLKPFRTPTPASGRAWETSLSTTQAQRDVQAWLNTVSQQAGRPRLAVISKAPRWYLDTLLPQCYPEVQWDAVLGHDDAGAAGHRYKPDPTLLQRLMEDLGVSPERTLVIGDEADDMEMAYRAGVRALMVDFYSLATKRYLEEEFQRQQEAAPSPAARAPKDWTYFNALEELPHAVCTDPRDLGNVIAHMNLHELPLEAALAGISLDQLRREARHTRLLCFSRTKKGSQGLPVTILGRYFTMPNDDKGICPLPAREDHVLTHQVLEKENGAVEVPDAWIEAVSHTLKMIAEAEQQPLLITIVPAKAHRPPRLENLLQRVSERLGAGAQDLLFNPSVFQFSQDARSNKTLNSEGRAANLEQNLFLHPNFQPQAGHTYVVIDDVMTTGSTFLRARELLETQGVPTGAVQALTVARTISFRERNRT